MKMLVAAIVLSAGSASAQVPALNELKRSAPADAEIAMPATPSSRPASPPKPDDRSADDPSQREINELIERVRGLRFRGPVDYKALPPDEFAAALAAMGTPREQARYIQGVYDWEGKILYSNASISPLQARSTRIHETVHALQDQIFGLKGLTQGAKTSDDRYIVRALIEGDATFTFIECMPESRAGRMLEIKRPWEFSGAKPSYDDGPAGAAAQVESAFDYGIAAKFIQTVKDHRGWDGVNALYRNPPLSTAQLLHPEKYFSGNAPKDVGLPDVSKRLPQGWRLARTNTQGEFLTYLMFLKSPATGPDAESLAEGWDGDTIRTYEKGEDSFSVWKSRWETPKDARKFLGGLQQLFPWVGLSYDPADNSVLALIDVPDALLQDVLELHARR